MENSWKFFRIKASGDGREPDIKQLEVSWPREKKRWCTSTLQGKLRHVWMFCGQPFLKYLSLPLVGYRIVGWLGSPEDKLAKESTKLLDCTNVCFYGSIPTTHGHEKYLQQLLLVDVVFAEIWRLNNLSWSEHILLHRIVQYSEQSLGAKAERGRADVSETRAVDMNHDFLLTPQTFQLSYTYRLNVFKMKLLGGH